MIGVWVGLRNNCVQLKSIEQKHNVTQVTPIFILILTFVTRSSPPPIAPLLLFYVVLSVSHQPLVVLSEKEEQSRK